LSHWNVFEGVDRFNTFFLIADAVLGFATVLVAGFLFEAWRRQRNRLVQFYIVEVLILTGIVAVCSKVYVFHRAQYRNESDILQAIEKTEHQGVKWYITINERTDWQLGGPSWLRQLIGDRPFQVFDRVIGIDASGEDIEHVVKLPNIKVVRISVATISNGQLKMLEQLPQLEALDMCFAMLDDEGQEIVDEDGYVVEQFFRLPRLPNLRGLNLYGTAFRGDGLENIPSIEILDLGNTSTDDKSVPALSALTKLKKMSLFDTDLSDSGIDQLRRALPNCEILR
jgi:hypothetical protein